MNVIYWLRYFLITFSNICMMIPLNQHLSQDFFTDFLHCTFPWTDITRKKFRLGLSAQELNYLDQRSFRFLLNVENCSVLPKQRRFSITMQGFSREEFQRPLFPLDYYYDDDDGRSSTAKQTSDHPGSKNLLLEPDLKFTTGNIVTSSSLQENISKIVTFSWREKIQRSHPGLIRE